MYNPKQFFYNPEDLIDENDFHIVYPETIKGNFLTNNNNYFKDTDSNNFNTIIQGNLIGICNKAVNWIELSKIPYSPESNK